VEDAAEARRGVDRWLPFGVSALASAVFFIDVCNWWFGCGCRSLWAGAATQCNVHAATGPRCPFCVRGVLGYVLVFGAVCLPQLLCSLRAPWSLGTRLVLCLALFPVAMVVLGVGLGWMDDYWTHMAALRLR